MKRFDCLRPVGVKRFLRDLAPKTQNYKIIAKSRRPRNRFIPAGFSSFFYLFSYWSHTLAQKKKTLPTWRPIIKSEERKPRPQPSDTTVMGLESLSALCCWTWSRMSSVQRTSRSHSNTRRSWTRDRPMPGLRPLVFEGHRFDIQVSQEKLMKNQMEKDVEH